MAIVFKGFFRNKNCRQREINDLWRLASRSWVKPLEKQSFNMIHKVVEALKVSRHTKIVIIAEQFSIQFFKQ